MIDLKKLKLKSTALKPMMQIGKNGLSESVIKEIIKLLKKKKILKIKLTKGSLEELNKKEMANLIAKKTDSIIISRIGFTVTIFPKKYLNPQQFK